VDHVLSDPAFQPVLDGAASVFEAARGRGVVSGEWGVLNEDEMLIWQAGQCPFCCSPFDDRMKSFASAKYIFQT
jgi:hypothetical protein